MLYLKKLVIIDECDEIVFKSDNKKAMEGLAEAMDFIQRKEGLKGLKKFLYDLDKQFKEMYRL